MYANFQSMLQFDPRQANLTNFFQAAPNQVPFQMRLDVPPQIAEFTDMAVGYTIFQLQNKMQQNANALRIYSFNRYSNNYWQNADFMTLVTFILKYAHMLLMNNQSNNPQDAIVNKSIPVVIDLISALPVRETNGELAQYLDQQTQAYVQNNALPELDRMFQTVENYFNGMTAGQPSSFGNNGSQFGNNNQFSGGQFQNNQYSNNHNNNNSNTGYGGRFQNNAPQQQQGSGNIGLSSAAGSRLFGNSVQTTPQNNNNGGNNTNAPSSGGRFAARASATPPQSFQPPVVSTPVEQPAPVAPVVSNEPTIHTLDDKSVKWKPSQEIPYFPAYNPSRAELFLLVSADKKTIRPALKDKDSIMDIDRHTLPGSFTAPKNFDFSNNRQTQAKIQAQIEEGPEHEITNVKIGEDNKGYVKQMTEGGMITDTSIEAAITTALCYRIKTITAEGMHLPMVFTNYLTIAEPVVLMKDESSLVEELSKARSFPLLQQMLNDMVDEMSPTLWNAINRKLTKTINRILMCNMSLPDYTIDSFAEDVVDLMKVLESEGTLYSKAFEMHQREIIKTLFDDVDITDLREVLDDNILGDNEYKQKPQITYLISTHSLTLLNCAAYELDLVLPKKVAGQIHKSQNPSLYVLLEALFKKTDNEDLAFDRHFIRTNDGVLMEATRGWLGDAYQLIQIG